MCLKYKAVSSFWWLQPVAASFWQIFSWAWLSNSNHTTVSRDSNHTVSNSKPAELLQQTTRGFQAAGIVREYPDRGNSPHTRYQFARYYSTKQDATFLWLNSRKKVHARCYVRAPLTEVFSIFRYFYNFTFSFFYFLHHIIITSVLFSSTDKYIIRYIIYLTVT